MSLMHINMYILNIIIEFKVKIISVHHNIHINHIIEYFQFEKIIFINNLNDSCIYAKYVYIITTNNTY